MDFTGMMDTIIFPITTILKIPIQWLKTGLYPCAFQKVALYGWGLWNQGLDRFDPESQTFTHFPNNPDDSTSLSNNTIPALLEDSKGNLWVGTHGGLNLFHPETGTFTRYQTIPGDTTSLSCNQVRAIYEDKQGAVWIGTGSPFGNESGPDEGGLNRYNYDTGTFTRFMHNPNDSTTLIDNKVRAIMEDSRGNFWVGTKGDGLHTMDRNTGKFTRHTLRPATSRKTKPRSHNFK
jgi:ligand-binding sensor domain-containing protein